MVHESEGNGQKWSVLALLQWCLDKIIFYDFIDKNYGCAPTEIKTETGLNKKTLYKYIKKAFEAELIEKCSIMDINGKTTNYTLIGKPKLKYLLNECKKLINDFYHKIEVTKE